MLRRFVGALGIISIAVFVNECVYFHFEAPRTRIHRVEEWDDVSSLLGPAPDRLSYWDPVTINHTRRLQLDDTDKVYTMRTLAIDPPIFEIEDFLTDEECDLIIKMAAERGLEASDFTYLDGTNMHERNKDTSQLSADEADSIFRYSDQTWLRHTSSRQLRELYTRVQRLAQLPDHILPQIEPMQVVKYKEYGHYESHYDSEAEHQGPCCIDPAIRGKGFMTGISALNRPLENRCRLCRFMTILYYLVDTEEGGGTVFPLADTTEEEYIAWFSSNEPDKYKQTRTCSPGLAVPPKKRKAVMWYNHEVDRGYLGPRQKKSLHGGCNVIKGQKWIANHWISEIPHPDVPRSPATGHY
eukprot:gene2269-5266_t